MLSGKVRPGQLQSLLQAAATQWSKCLTPAVGKATAASDAKPFQYQDMLEMETKPDIPWKKLTGG